MGYEATTGQVRQEICWYCAPDEATRARLPHRGPCARCASDMYGDDDREDAMEDRSVVGALRNIVVLYRRHRLRFSDIERADDAYRALRIAHDLKILSDLEAMVLVARIVKGYSINRTISFIPPRERSDGTYAVCSPATVKLRTKTGIAKLLDWLAGRPIVTNDDEDREED